MEVPKLRFKNKYGKDYPGWDSKKLNQIATKCTKKNKENSVNEVLTNSATKGIIKQKDYFDKNIANQSNLNRYYLVQKDDFVYNPRISVHAPVGPIKRNKLILGVMSPLYNIFRFENRNLNFIEFYFETTYWHRYMKSVANFGARHDRMNITNSDLFKMPIPTPGEEEQQKIASFLTAVDKRISLLHRRATLLEEYKKGVMQKLFSQELRFKDDNGQDFPNWEEKKLGEVCKIVVGGTPKTSVKEYWGGDIGWIGSGEIKNNHIAKPSKFITKLGLEKSSTYLMPLNTVVLAMTGATLGKIGILDKAFSGNQSVAGFLPSKNYVSLYLFYNLQNNTNLIKSFAGGAAQAGINKKNIEALKLFFPVLQEQQKIASFLESLDKKIATVNQQIEGMQTFKKGLLQQMFV